MRQRLAAGYCHPTIFSIEQRIFGNLFEYLPGGFFFTRDAASIYGTHFNAEAAGNADIAVGDYLARPVAVQGDSLMRAGFYATAASNTLVSKVHELRTW